MTSMQDLVANIDHLVFDVEIALESQLGAQLLPFHSMDKSGSAVCVFYASGQCDKGSQCPYRHITGEKSVVCKHWLRGLCKKGDQCEFLHEYDLAKMPECYFFSKYNACSNKECPFRHIDPESKIKDCPWYDRGFCRHGPHCKSRHRRRVMCPFYMNGFCLDGPKCKYSHPSFDVPVPDSNVVRKFPFSMGIVCHNCHERGHKATQCPHLPGSGDDRPLINSARMPAQPVEKKPIHEVTCYKCGEKGHYANKCSKGALAFLSQSARVGQDTRLQDEQAKLQRLQATLAGRSRAGEMMR